MIVISRLFDQAVLLVGQKYNSIGYQERMNILSALTDNNTNANEILKEASLKLDDVDNEDIFGNRFEKKIGKND